MNREERRATAIQRRLADYEDELNETYDEDLPGFDLEALRTAYEAKVEAAREEHIATLLSSRREKLQRMSDEELLEDDEENAGGNQ